MNTATEARVLPGKTTALEGLDLYRVFAACFGSPSRERFAWLSGREFRTLLKQLASELAGVAGAASSGFPSYEAYEAAYLALFEVGVPGPPVPLLESAHTERAVPQEIILECVNFYEVLGLHPSGSAFPADHLVTQLEFLAAVRYLREGKTDPAEVASLQRLENDFLERHVLSWLPAAQKKLAKLNPPVFPALLQLLIRYAARAKSTEAAATAY